MKQLKFLFIGILLLCSANLFGQGTSMTIGTASAAAGDTVTVPINVTDFTNVGAISLKISYDASALTYVGLSNSAVAFINNGVNGVVTLGWFDATASTPLNITSGKLVDLKFVSVNGGLSNLSFMTSQCDISNESGTSITTSYNNGSVNAGATTGFNLQNVTSTPGSKVDMPLNFHSLTNVGAVSIKINFDPSVLTFDSVSNSLNGIQFTATANNGVLAISWFDQTGNSPINADSGKLLDLMFTYKGGTSSLSFVKDSSEISNNLGVVLNVTFVDGSVAPAPGSVPTVKIGDVTGASIGAVSVPVNVQAFNNIGAISFKIAYNPSVLSFTSVANAPAGVNVTATADSGVITLSWFDMTANTPINITNGKLLDLNFTYNGGTSSLAFKTTLCDLSDESGTSLVGVIYQNGSVSGGTTSNPTLTLAQVTSTPNSQVSIPLTVKSFNNVGAISLKINYNTTALTFINISDAPAGVVFTSNASNGVLTIGWFDATGNTPINLDSNAVLAKLNFTYNGGSSALTFNVAQCEISNDAGTPLTNVSYVNGSVGLVSASPTLQIGSAVAKSGTKLTLPVDVKSFNNVGAISLKIQYDATVLTFDSISNAANNLVFSKNATNGVLTIGWFDQTGNTPVNLDSALLLDLNFTYNGGSSNLTFLNSQSEISSGTGVAFSNVIYMNGSVAPLGGSPTLSLPKVFLKTNSNVTVPLNASGLTGIGAVSVQIQYNAAVLNFTGATSAINGVTFNASANNGVISISWFDATGTSPINLDSGKVLDLSFGYQAGISSLTFLTDKSEFSDSLGRQILGVLYNNGSIGANSKPYFTKTLDAATITGLDTLSFQYAAADSNGQSLTFLLLNPRASISIDASTGLLTVIGKNSSSNFTINVGVTDGIDTTVTSMAITTVTGIEKDKNEIPKEFSMEQNYPNPFNPSTNIDFAIPKESKVVLKIYNLLGQEVATLVNQELPAGNYRYSFNASNLSSGMYIYRLQAGNYLFTKKMTLLK